MGFLTSFYLTMHGTSIRFGSRLDPAIPVAIIVTENIQTFWRTIKANQNLKSHGHDQTALVPYWRVMYHCCGEIIKYYIQGTKLQYNFNRFLDVLPLNMQSTGLSFLTQIALQLTLGAHHHRYLCLLNRMPQYLTS